MSSDCRVFVVDDDQLLRTSLADLLDKEGYTVEHFASPAEYLAHREFLGPACIILDVKLPDLDGFTLHKRLMQRGGLEEIVFVTGHGDIPMGVQAMKNGAVDFLPKPFDDEVLLRAVSQAIARSCERWQMREETSRIRARLAKLTPREFEVFRLVVSGLLNKQIAAELGASVRTIKTHRGRVMRKLCVESVADLVRLEQNLSAVAPRW